MLVKTVSSFAFSSQSEQTAPVSRKQQLGHTHTHTYISIHAYTYAHIWAWTLPLSWNSTFYFMVSDGKEADLYSCSADSQTEAKRYGWRLARKQMQVICLALWPHAAAALNAHYICLPGCSKYVDVCIYFTFPLPWLWKLRPLFVFVRRCCWRRETADIGPH